jgi:hypothetical protein
MVICKHAVWLTVLSVIPKAASSENLEASQPTFLSPCTPVYSSVAFSINTMLELLAHSNNGFGIKEGGLDKAFRDDP